MEQIVRCRLRLRGVVQGVGFRPFVANLARRHGLTGLVGNDVSGLFLEVQGTTSAIDRFRRDLVERPPPAAIVDAITIEALTAIDEQGFVIVPSRVRPDARTPVTPDLAICDACLHELFDPSDRRFRYPFLNCTHCGPRFTILRQLPYDRAQTTMASFPMCAACEAEYHNPADRRFHAQPNACPDCGPGVWLVPSSRASLASERPDEPAEWPQGENAVRRALATLADGQVLALKGLGGFHLACDATNPDAVALLRQRKRRTHRPFALMAASLDQIRVHAEVSEDEARLLSGSARPIVLLRRRSGSRGPAPLCEQVAPGNAYLGFMLPYTPLHYLLVGDRPLVMTSGNLSDEPIARENAEAMTRLVGIADELLLHDRPIQVVCDDSVVRVFEGQESPVRRSRGYAPLPIPWPAAEGPTVLAVGGELKATFCLAIPPYAHMSQHIGDMENLPTENAMRSAVEHFLTLYQARPDLVACDLHPDYLSTRWAEEFARERGLPLIRVQHHHAHAASLMVEHGWERSQPALAVIFDGAGLGADGAIWGGELFATGDRDFRRMAHLKYVAMPGGDTAHKRPYRAALAHLRAAGIAWSPDLPCVAACPDAERALLSTMIDRGLHSPLTSSMGRLFDAVSSLLGVRQIAEYEAQAAIELEAISAVEEGPLENPFDVQDGVEPWIIDPTGLFEELVAGLREGQSPPRLAGWFHRGVAALIVTLAERAQTQTGVRTVGLSGGVFQNMLLQRLAVRTLRSRGFEVLIHRRVPANDGGIALGQAMLAPAQQRPAVPTSESAHCVTRGRLPQ